MVKLLIFLKITIVINSNLKQQITGQTGNSGTKNVEIMVPLKCPSNFLRTLEMPLINCEISLYFKWSSKYIIVTKRKISINDMKL